MAAEFVSARITLSAPLPRVSRPAWWQRAGFISRAHAQVFTLSLGHVVVLVAAAADLLAR